jgi:hypothetical protein
VLRPARLARRCWTGCVVVALLTVQLATAAYACPKEAASAELAAMAGMPCAEMMAGTGSVDADQPGLCHAHCQADASRPTLDPSPSASLLAPALLQMVAPTPAPKLSAAPAWWAAHERKRDRAPPEAHSLHHCCYRL